MSEMMKMFWTQMLVNAGASAIFGIVAVFATGMGVTAFLCGFFAAFFILLLVQFVMFIAKHG